MIGTKILEEQKSKYNGHLRVVRTLGLGTYIQADGLTQSGGIVESIWRSTLGTLKKNVVAKILILGLGGGTAARLAKKIWPAAKVTGIDIDPSIIELGEKYLGLDKKNIEIKIVDAYRFDCAGYDLVLVDLYNGTEYPKKFEDEKFIRKLTNNKVVVFNRTYYGEKRPEAVKFGRNLEKIFPKVKWFYPEANLMFICRK